MLKVNFNLKDKIKSEELVVCSISYRNQRIKVSTKKKAFVCAWDKKTQRCITSSTLPDRINRASKKLNKYLDKLETLISLSRFKRRTCEVFN